MKKPLLYLLLLFSLFGGAACLKSGAQTDQRTSGEKTENGPCAFLSSEAPDTVLISKLEREKSGYDAEITLAEAVNQFNEESKCYPMRSGMPPLSVEEVVAAISAGELYWLRDAWKLQKPTLLKILREKKMPKGSLIVYSNSGISEGELRNGEVSKEDRGTFSQCHRIYVYLDLDKNPEAAGNTMRPEQIFLVRKAFSAPGS